MIEEHSGQTWRCESLAQLGNKAGMWWAWAGGFLSIWGGESQEMRLGRALCSCWALCSSGYWSVMWSLKGAE